MAAVTLHELNQRYVRLTDRCRSQWTFYQLLQGLFKRLRDSPCPIEIDFQGLFAELRDLAQELGSPHPERTEELIGALAARLDQHVTRLAKVDAEVPPSLLRRFFDKLRTQDEKVLLAVLKFYAETGSSSEDTSDKIDILLTRLAELPGADGRLLLRSAHEIERLQRRGSNRLAEVLEWGSQSLQRAAELERRFVWFIEDALYRGDTEHLEHLHRSRFRHLRAYAELWLVHNERGGISPL